MRIFGGRIDDIPSKNNLAGRFEDFLHGNKTNVVFTLNPEILLYARTHGDFVTTLSSADLSLPDGFGITLVQFLKNRQHIRRFAGIDAAESLFPLAAQQNATILLFGGEKGAATRASKNFRKRFPQLRIFAVGEDVCFRNSGRACEKKSEQRITQTISAYEPQIIFVGLGAPKQENWIALYRNEFPSVRIMIAVGGAFDIWSGRLRRAPKILRASGLEWLWRLVQEPKRLPRIWRAVCIFPLQALRDGSKIR